MIGLVVLLTTSRNLVASTAHYRESHLIAIAREAVVNAAGGKQANSISAEFSPPLPVFVTIEVNGVVRGCRGDLRTRTRSLDDEVTLAATDAASRDPRYRPISAIELSRFLVTVTIVQRTEPISDLSTLTPEDGLVLTSGNHVGVVLPWEGRDPNVRLNWAYKKAGVAKGTQVSLDRLVATRFRG
jgi:AMMECR1 domain-containing protein